MNVLHPNSARALQLTRGTRPGWLQRLTCLIRGIRSLKAEDWTFALSLTRRRIQRSKVIPHTCMRSLATSAKRRARKDDDACCCHDTAASATGVGPSHRMPESSREDVRAHRTRNQTIDIHCKAHSTDLITLSCESKGRHSRGGNRPHNRVDGVQKGNGSGTCGCGFGLRSISRGQMLNREIRARFAHA